MIVSYRDMFNLLMQLGMAIDSYSTTQNLYIGRGPNIYQSHAHTLFGRDLGTRLISTIDMGLGVPISM